ncbi:hypothetical protein QE152_g7408 [Popillia japonica]|uniref:Uncharacterized protein n=1 Tax=Popillia japonica TaxID=7064 RepID=A0AAW1MGF6_POPJA
MITIPCQKEETREEDWEGGDEDLHKEERTPVVCAEVPSDQLKLVKSVEYGGQPVLAQQKEMITIPCQKEETREEDWGRITIPCQKEETREEDWGRRI